jgi:diaminopimelate epimerase
MKFYKYHALGNDYVVLDPLDQPLALTPAHIRAICHRHYGLGSDGLLLGPLPSRRAAFGLRIFNPDGTEAEKSGNGLRIFSRYLWDQQRVQAAPFDIDTPGGVVRACVLEAGRQVRVEMGRVSFWSTDIPVAGDGREVLQEPLRLGEANFRFSGATLGNPHCVIVVPEASPELAQRYGPLAETNPLFPHRTNVQFVTVIDPANLQIEIWERGAGYTLASGSSSCAAAAVARRLGLCAAEVRVHMPGGQISVALDEHFGAVMTGPVTRIGAGELADEMFAAGAPEGEAA